VPLVLDTLYKHRSGQRYESEIF